MAGKRPNVLIFMTDQQQEQVTRFDHPCQMPNLKRFASDAVRFTRHYTTMAHCCPSRASFFSGLYPSEHGVYNNVSNEAALSEGIRKNVKTFGETLKEHDYALYFSGKWHLSSVENPADRGWQELVVTAGKNAYMTTSIEEWRKMPQPKQDVRRPRGHLSRPGWGDYQLYGEGDSSYRMDKKVIDAAVDQLDLLKDAEDPWCLYVGLFSPHDPFIVPQRYLDRYDIEQIELPENYRDTLLDKPGYFRRLKSQWDQLSEQEVKESILHYWAYNTMLDEMFGEILAALERTGQEEDTLVIFTSDHGESLGAHGLYLKGVSPYEETYRIPCILRYPAGWTGGGREITELTSIIDVAPTILDVCVGDHASSMSGRSWVPLLKGEPHAHWREAVFTQCNGVEVYFTQRMVITEQYKLVYNPVDFDELYDLKRDPMELTNRIEDPDLTAVRKHLFSLLWKNAAETRDRIFSPYPTASLAEYGPTVGIGVSN